MVTRDDSHSLHYLLESLATRQKLGLHYGPNLDFFSDSMVVIYILERMYTELNEKDRHTFQGHKVEQAVQHLIISIDDFSHTLHQACLPHLAHLDTPMQCQTRYYEHRHANVFLLDENLPKGQPLIL